MGWFEKLYAKGCSASGAAREEQAKALRQNVTMTEHQEDLDELLKRYKTSQERGLTPEQAQAHLQEFGALPAPSLTETSRVKPPRRRHERIDAPAENARVGEVHGADSASIFQLELWDEGVTVSIKRRTR